MATTTLPTAADVYEVLQTVTDPEVPVLTIVDLGIVRDVRVHHDTGVEVVITPTYSGCPAMNTIELNIYEALAKAGMAPAKVVTVLSPPWTTDWLSAEGRAKLLAYGIAPPVQGGVDKGALFAQQREVACPQCGATDTRMLSQFGSTACKALYQCNVCREPFDYFKCH